MCDGTASDRFFLTMIIYRMKGNVKEKFAGLQGKQALGAPVV